MPGSISPDAHGPQSTSIATASSAAPSGPGHVLANGAATSSGESQAKSAIGPVATSPAVRTGVNLLTTNQITFQPNGGGWVVNGGVFSLLPGAGATSVSTLNLLPTVNGGSVSAFSGSAQNGGLTPASPGLLYSGTADVKASGTEWAEAVVAFVDQSGNKITSVGGQASKLAAGVWVPLNAALGIAPANAASAVLGVIVWSVSLGETTAVQAPSLVASTDPGSPAISGPLSTSGNELLDGLGRPVLLHGVELNGMDRNWTPDSITQDTIEQAKVWGANEIRVALGEQYWLPSSCSYSPAYAPAVNQVVNWITSLGMVAVVELADIVVTPCGQPGDYDMADSANAPNFWRQVAAHFAGNPLVVFDLYNEPHKITDQVWLSGGTAMDGLIPYSAAGMQQLYGAVRSSGATNVVLVSGNNWANDLPTTLVSGTNIIYGVHVYTCPQTPPPNCSHPNPYDPTPILGSWVGAPVPVVVSEFGWPAMNNGTYNANVISYAQAHGWGWSAFAWSENPPFGILATNPAGGPYEPTASGMPVLAALAADA